jgi:hypothetical protein
MSKIYLLKCGDADVVFTDSKPLAKLYKKQRGGKNVTMCSVSRKKFPEEYLEQQDSRRLQLYYEYAMTEDEYLYFEEAFNQWVSDAIVDIEHFIKYVTLVRFTKEEAEILKPLMHILGEHMHNYEHGTLFEDICFEEYFDYNYALKFFIDKVL